MAESFLFNIAERVLEKIAHLAVEELRLAFCVKSDLRKLQETMTSIKAVLLDAERQQHQNEKLRLCMWKLRDIFYDAEDVLDEFHCEALRKQVVNHPGISTKVRFLASCSFPLSFSLKVGHKIREIHQRLDELDTEWKSFNLGQGGDNRHVIHRETHSFVNSSDVIGRDVDKENIINRLMEPSKAGDIPVIPIVGIGGLGKTTLAQLVYNDDRVTRLFPLKIWVCVSEEFTLARLLKLIIHSVNEKEKCDDSTVEALQTCLRRLLNDKKFLLILDDVWNEDRGRWIEFRDLLKSMGDFSQSKIIVTTRSREVAKIMSSIHPYELNGLPHDECLTLFAKWAFNDGDERQHPNLMRIGEE
ncbi:disease resistance protein RGA2-like, partial [Durio zibethinus]|uniref:Disease resistance protein RGA2-like n=1 Tax=Durio zibethinus TaxID=66656 RepID=A0A6P5YTE4_DURZI